MGCCLEVEELTLYKTVAKVKNQYRTGIFLPVVCCYKCNGVLEHKFMQKQFLGFTIRVDCPHCGWKFEG